MKEGRESGRGKEKQIGVLQTLVRKGLGGRVGTLKDDPGYWIKGYSSSQTF